MSQSRLVGRRLNLEKYPKYLFILELHSLEFHSIIVVPRIEEIRSLVWNEHDDLFFSWGSTALGVWNPESIGAINPAYSKPFKVSNLQFGSDKSTMLLRGGKSLCIYYADVFAKPKVASKPPKDPFFAPEGDTRRSGLTSAHHEDRSANLRKVEVDTTRRSHEIRTEDLIDMYDRRATPEKGSMEREYESNETFGRRDDYYDRGQYSRKR